MPFGSEGVETGIGLIFFHNKRHPAEMAEPEIARFLSNWQPNQE